MAGNSTSISRSTVGVTRSSSTTTSVPSRGGSRTSTTSSWSPITSSSGRTSTTSFWNAKSTISSPSVTTIVSSPYQLPSTGGSRSTILVSNPTKTTTGGSRSTVLTSNPTKTTTSSYSKGYTTYGGYGSTRTGTYVQKIDTLTTGSSKVVEDMKAAAYYSPYTTGRATYSTGRTYYSPASSADYYEEERQRRAKQEWNSIENDIADLNRNRSVVANTLDDFVINNRTIGSSTYPNNSRTHTDIYLPTKDSEYVDAIEQVKRDRDKASRTITKINDYNKKYPDIARTITSSSGRTITGKNSELALAQQREAGANNTIKELETARQNVDKANASQRTVYVPQSTKKEFGNAFTIMNLSTGKKKESFWDNNEYLDKSKKEQEEREKKKAEEEKEKEKTSFWDNNEYLEKSKKEQEEKEQKKAEEEKQGQNLTNMQKLYAAFAQLGWYDENGNLIPGYWDKILRGDPEYTENGKYPFGKFGRTIAEAGCSICSCASVVSYLTGKLTTPVDVAKLYDSPTDNKSDNFTKKVLEDGYGLDTTSDYTFSDSDNDGSLYRDNVLENGGAIIKSMRNGGHWVAILDVDYSGGEKKYYVADSEKGPFVSTEAGRWVSEKDYAWSDYASSGNTTIYVAPRGKSADDIVHKSKVSV